MYQVKTFLVAMAVVMALDFLWLGLLMPSFYSTQLGGLARRSGNSLAPIWWAAIVVYLMIPAGIQYFVVPRSETPLDGLLIGAIFGVVLYGVYDFTNYSTLAGWPLTLALVDVAWGGVVCGLSSAAAVAASRYFQG